MDNYVDSIYSDQSQATQLLKNAIGANGIAKSAAPPGPEYCLQDDYLSDASPRATIAQYRLQGLGITQTQSGECGRGASLVERSPSESFQPPGLKMMTRESPSGDNNATERKDSVAVVAGIVNNVLQSAILDSPRRTPTTKNAMPSPAPTPPSKRKSATHIKERCLSPLSDFDDSFASAPQELQHKHYTATPKTVPMPLSQFGRTQEDSQEDVEYYSSQEESSRNQSKHHILAPSSEPSEGHSQNDFEDIMPSAQVQVEDYDLNVSMSSSNEAELHFEDAWNKDYHPPIPDPVPVPDVPSQDKTQPTTPAESLSSRQNLHQASAQQTAASDATGRSIFSMIDPRKVQRYQAALVAGQSSKSSARPNLLQSLANIEETQPSDSSHLPATGQRPGSDVLFALGELQNTQVTEPSKFSSAVYRLSPADLPDNYEETQPTTSSNLPATGQSPRNTSLQPVSPQASIHHDDALEETQPSTASSLPPTGERIRKELQSSPARWPKAARALFSNLADLSDIDTVPDSETFSSGPMRAPTLSPVIPSPTLTPIQPVKPPSKPKTPALRSPKKALPETENNVAEPSNTSQPEPIIISSDDDEAEIPLAKQVEKAKVMKEDTPIGKRTRGMSTSLMPPPAKKTQKAPKRKNAARQKRAAVPSTLESERSIPRKATKAATPGAARQTPRPVTPVRSPLVQQPSETRTAFLDEVRTEVADSDDTESDDDDDEYEETPSVVKKRKRGPAKGNSVARSATRSTRQGSATPAGRSNKRLKTTPLLRSESAVATKVFALWKQNSYYYSGVVQSECEEEVGRYVVHFDDQTHDNVAISGLRICELRTGDHVQMVSDGESGVVVADVSDPRPSSMVSVNVGNEDEEDIRMYRLDDIRIPSRTIQNQWKDRTLTANQIVTVQKAKSLRKTLSPAGTCAIKVPSKNLVLHKIAFVVTLTDSYADKRLELCKTIEDNGGTIIDDWGKLFSMGGKHSSQGKSWRIGPENMEFLKADNKNIDRVFLLADDCNKKPKFLIALALGVPCLELDWVHHCVEQQTELDWHRYLLPAGSSEVLSTRITQQVDLSWGTSIHHLEDILANPVASRILEGKSVLCVNPLFVPPMPPKPHASFDEHGSMSMIPRILLTMGASEVEAVTELRYASMKAADYDYVVVRDGKVDRALSALPNRVLFSWIKECLVAGRVLPQ